MMSGTVPVSILGTNFAMAQHPFWKPDQYSTCILSIRLLCWAGGGGFNTADLDLYSPHHWYDSR